MRRRSVTLALLGVLILGSIAAPLINSPCERCGGKGNVECLTCQGIGAVPRFLLVPCPCKANPECSLCYGVGYYPAITAEPCPECQGKGRIPCPFCRGDGQRSLLDRIPDLWQEEASQ